MSGDGSGSVISTTGASEELWNSVPQELWSSCGTDGAHCVICLSCVSASATSSLAVDLCSVPGDGDGVGVTQPQLPAVAAAAAMEVAGSGWRSDSGGGSGVFVCVSVCEPLTCLSNCAWRLTAITA